LTSRSLLRDLRQTNIVTDSNLELVTRRGVKGRACVLAGFSELPFLVDSGRFSNLVRAVRTAAPGRVDDLAATRTGVYQFLGAMRTGYELGVNSTLAGGTA
jgi:hypothetical protein